MLFATPDFGAAAAAFGVVLVAGFIVFTLAFTGISWGARIIKHGNKVWGVCLVAVSGLMPVTFCLTPNIVARCTYGRFLLASDPGGTIAKGMSMDEVQAILGNPHERNLNGGRGERWFYYIGLTGIGYFGVDFGMDGRVASTYGD